MDPQNYDFCVPSELSAEKKNILRQLNDMFYAIPLDRIRDICDQCLWNVDLCIDKLISFKGDDDREQPQPEKKALNPNAPSFSSILQSTLAGGAIPKGNTCGLATQPKSCTYGLPAVYASIYDNINNGYKVLIIMRGAPGSGKSHLAKSIVRKLLPGKDWKDFVLSADDYFFDSLGRYRYNIERLDDAHKYCQTRAREKTSLGWSPVIIDNTNMQLWELLPYVQVAVENGYMVELMEPTTSWRNSAGRLAAKNTHNVQKQKIQRMLDNYEVATTRDVLMLLKQTRYTVSLPQFRSYPPPPNISLPEPAPPQKPPIAAPLPTVSTNTRIAMEIESNQPIEEEVMQIVRAPSNSSVTFVETNSACMSHEATVDVKQYPIPKSPRQNRKKQQQQHKADENSAEEEATNQWCFPLTPSRSKTFEDYHETPAQLFPTPPTVWQAYEQEATKFWGVPLSSLPSNSKPSEPMTTDQNDGCGLLQLLKEGVKSINVPSKGKSPINELELPANEFMRHRIGCENENSSFIGLRQIYPNKPTTELWDLFVKCNGSIDWAVDILLKDDDTAGYDNASDLIENFDNYDCGCDNPMNESAPLLPLLTIPITEITAKPQRQKTPRNRVRTAELLEVKDAVEKSFVLGDEHYSSRMKKIRNKRPTTEDTSVGDQRKTYVDIQVQTDGDENDNISEEGPDGSEILEINLGENLIGQLSTIFKAETPALATPENYKTNVFMPKSLARELYLLWMESMYNQMEEERQSLLKEDEDFARLLKNPKYENCKQPPENIKELLDMEFAWMVYKTEQEEYRASANQHKRPNDLASHLTRMKLCEIFPNIPKETLYDILAAHNNKFSDTVDVLKSTIQPVLIDHQVTANVLIEKALDENDKLNKEAEQEQNKPKNNNNSISHSSSATHIHSMSQADDQARRRSLSPDEAKRLALKEFEDARNYAAHHCQLRAECYQKAKDAIQRGNSGVAVYYSHIANLHKKKIDIYNNRAANCIMEVHDLTQNNPDFIDLHYLHVIEAIACLDIFIDKHIAKLRSIFRSFKYVFIITGRGLHSTGGVSTIKTRVKSRLKDRNLKWSEVNPGLLKVKIFSASKYAKSL